MRKTKPAARKLAAAKKKPASPRKKKGAAPKRAEPKKPVEEIESVVVDVDVGPTIVDVELDADLLADLIEKTEADPGAPFAPEVLAALADLKRKDRKAFESLRAGLKRAGCRVGLLDEQNS